ncbi:MAG: winged helix DNA-binding domain-containing protein [Actinomycetota bacterium]|nr:winged helix DNA-binding domain-containing protein [Actinomycetota bacterium]
MSLSADEARRAALRAQGLLGAEGRRGGVRGMLRRLGSVQLDTISVLARSHELVPYARLGAVPRPRVEKAYWSSSPSAHCFEYWSHAACILPAEEWPLFAFRRRAFRARGQRWHKVSREACDRVLESIRATGPMTVSELGGGRNGGEWWDWSEVKVAVEWLLDTGEVVCAERRAWKRVYDLPERTLAPDLIATELDDDACLTRLVEQAGAAMGVATEADLADYHRVRREQVAAVIADTVLELVEVDGWGKPAWAHPGALAQLATRGRHRTTLLSPFDSLIWDRPRTLRVFGFRHSLEAYVPAPRRVHGYFAMPLLAGGRLRGRVDPGREGATLVAKRLSCEPDAAGDMADALKEAAAWVGCDAVRLGEVDPPELRAPLAAALA